MTAKIAIIFTLIHTMVIETILKFKLLMVGEFIIEINLLIFRSIATTLVMLTDERSPSDGKHLENMIDARFILLLVNSNDFFLISSVYQVVLQMHHAKHRPIL